MKKRVKKIRIRLVPNRDGCPADSSYAAHLWRKYEGRIGVAEVWYPLVEIGEHRNHVWHCYCMEAPTELSGHNLDAGGVVWKFSGDLKAMKRHYPKEYAARKAAGLLVSASGRKLP